MEELKREEMEALNTLEEMAPVATPTTTELIESVSTESEGSGVAGLVVLGLGIAAVAGGAVYGGRKLYKWIKGKKAAKNGEVVVDVDGDTVDVEATEESESSSNENE